MLKNYLTIGWRNLVRNTGFSLINISGLTVGMTVSMLIGFWVHDELSFNRNFKNYDRIGAVWHHLTFNGEIISHNGTPYPYANEARSTFPEFKQVVKALGPYDLVISDADNQFSRKGLYVEPEFLDMFSANIVAGSQKPLDELHSIIINQSLAKALSDNDIIGKVIKFNSDDDLVVTGVFEDFPANSNFGEIQMITSLEYYASISEANRNGTNGWGNLIFDTYVMLNDNVKFEDVSKKITGFLGEKSVKEIQAINPVGFVFPMSDWNLRSNFKDGKQAGGKIDFVWMFGTVGIFILILACINFVNLSTARSEKRSKEIGVRKVMGSRREQLVAQFLSESQLITVIAFLLSLVLVMMLLPWYNTIAEKNITIPFGNPWFIAICLAFITFTSVMAGSYPALYMSSFNPVKVLKGAIRTGRASLTLRKALVVFQFTICIAIIGCTIVVFQQIQYSKDRPAGFDQKGAFFIQIKTPVLQKADYNLMRNDLLANGVIENMATSDHPISGGMGADAAITWQGKDPAHQPLIAFNVVSHDFPKTNGFLFVEGRDFSRDYRTDSLAIVVNEMCASLVAPGKSALGSKMTLGGREREIIGVIKDQLRWGPYSKQSPHVYLIGYKNSPFITIRISKDASVKAALAHAETVVHKYDPGAPFDYKFIDEDFGQQFRTEERAGNMAAVFALLAIFISCMGVLGLASFAASQRVKEIGVRKVLGASVFSIWRMLSKDFVILVVIAIVIGVPISRYVADQWLAKYDYRVDISWWVFVATGLGALAITLGTISYQAIKAASANPVNSLRSE
ncbi:MAG TPA: FtsX-like permease family protein [Cyclobacteriaceae bacterium]|nr:FtsX-like permease family protein [Cyclobacteriaceae bacterium]